MDADSLLNGVYGKGRSAPPLIGREDHLGVVDAALAAVDRGGTGAVFFTAGRGLGKTRTLSAATDLLRAAGAVVLEGRCLDIGELSWCALRAALTRLAAGPDHAGTPDAAAVAQLVAQLDSGSSSLDSAGPLFHRISTGLQEIADGQPIAVVIDDLQWVDTATLRFLQYVLAGLGPARSLLVAGVRLNDLPADHRVARMLADLRRQPSVMVLDLKPLTRAETDELVAAIVNAPCEPTRADLLWTRSGGNPFLVEALAQAERGGVDELPDSLRDIALAQIAALPPDAQTLVKAVVVGVKPVPYTLLLEVTQLNEERAAGAADTAVRERILDIGPDGYHFHVGIYREVIEAELPQPERVLLNRRYAQALSASGVAVHQGRLARHWLAAEEPREAWPCAVAAARWAQELHRYAEAYAHWARALSIIEDIDDPKVPVAERRLMWRRAAETAHRSGDHDRALQVLDEMAKTLPRPLPSWWHLMRARYLTRAEQPRAALTEYELAQAAADNCPPRDRAEATAHLADLLVQLGRYADARRAAGEALAIARGRPGCASILVLASAALGFSQAYLDDPDAGRDTVEQALAAAQKHGAHTDVLRAHLHLAELLTGPLNELESGVEVARRGAAQAEKWGLGRTYGSRLLAVAANGMFRAGRWADAEAAIDTGLRHRPSGVADVELLLARARVCLAYGDLDAAESDLNAVETLTAGGGSARHLLPLATLRAGLALWRGRHAEAREAVEHGLSRYDDQTEDLEVRAALVWHGLRAEAEAPAYAAGRIAALRQAAGQLTQESGNAAVPVRDAVAGYLALCEAELSRISGESSVALWERAAHTWESRHHPYPAAYARLRHAEALYYTERFRNATAGTSLKRAYRAAADLGARPLAAEIRDLASRARVQLEEADEGPDLAEAADEAALPAGPLAKLTAREREVLELVAAGHTNQEIGKSLFISGSTVGVHISKILAKLQVRSRLQASTIYRRWRPDSDR